MDSALTTGHSGSEVLATAAANCSKALSTAASEFSASTTICVAHSRSEEVGLALGAQAGPARLAAVFREAGFRSVHVAHETPFNIILEVRR